jgi:hypothetical protein
MKKNINEGLIGAAKKFSDAFFDGLKANAVNTVIQKAKDVKMNPEVVKTMERIKKEKEELDKLLGL